ncbi:MAG: hypothetical protein HQL86_04770 [Magnetococcales bacterium]|nr:hypothetical protein [Magnetococcales bacterium]
MVREKGIDPTDFELLAGEVHARIDHLYQRQAKLLRRMDELERATREQLDRFAAAWPSSLIERVIARQEELFRRVEEQEEESARIYANQNELLHSLDATLNEIRQRMDQLSERESRQLPPVVGARESE